MKLKDILRKYRLDTLISPFYFGFKRKARQMGLGITLTILKIFPNRLSLTYAPSIMKDGVGAQAQRLLAIYSLAKSLGVGYSHSPIEDVAVHPLDPYKSEQEYSSFLVRLNEYFSLPNMEISNKRELIRITFAELSQRRLLKQLLISIFSGNRFEIATVNPYLLVDLHPKIYEFARKDLISNKDSIREKETTDSKLVGVHYRQGVGGFVIQNGEKFPRQLEIDYFMKAINLSLPKSNFGKIGLRVFSDAPSSNTVFSPPADQMYLWQGTPRFVDGSIEVIAADLSAFGEIPGVDVEFMRGGDALDAIVQMRSMDVLILSKSSLSYVAAILAKNQEVIYPRGFWHPKLPHWIGLRSL